MKIAIPINEKEPESGVCISFGRTPFFYIYDTETQSGDAVVNTAADSQGGAGIKAAQELADNKIDILLTPRCGENAAAVLNTAGIKMYKTSGDSVNDNIKAFINGELQVLNDVHPGFHGHGG